MGANAQTTVQKFLSGAVLTAEQQNISAATGVPVFATTVTRDAAFGGANKVLAEGQTCYLESTNVVQYYDGAAWATVGEVSKVVKMVNTQTGAMATGTTVIPFNDTIPQITEGNEYMTRTITPSHADNILLIQVSVYLTSNAAGTMSAALFVGTTADALAASSLYCGGANEVTPVNFTRHIVAGATTELTFRVRAGNTSAGTTTFNGNVAARIFGGIASMSSITITEYTP